jgi:hypothetical protein
MLHFFFFFFFFYDIRPLIISFKLSGLHFHGYKLLWDDALVLIYFKGAFTLTSVRIITCGETCISSDLSGALRRTRKGSQLIRSSDDKAHSRIHINVNTEWVSVLTAAMSLSKAMIPSARRRAIQPRSHHLCPSGARGCTDVAKEAVAAVLLAWPDEVSPPLPPFTRTCSVNALAITLRKTSSMPAL